MSKLEKAYKNATSLKNKATTQVNEERLFLNEKGINAEKSFEGKTKYGYNKLQQYKPTAGDINNPIAKLIKIFEQTLQNGEPLLSKFSNFYLTKGDLIHLIPRTILLFLSIFIIITEVILLLISPVIEAIPFIGPPLLKLLQFFSLPKELYFMFYGGIKFVLCFTILLSVIILIKEREDYFSASMKDILFLFIVFVINLLPYLYDLLSYIIHLGIMDGFYRYKCQRDSEDNEKVIANKFNLIAILEFGILLIGLISFLYYFLRHYFYPNVKKDDQKNPWYIESLPLFMFFVPILYLGILYICNFIEKELSDMVLTNMSSMNEDIPDEKNCVAGPGQCEDSDDNKLTGLLKLFIYGGISFFIVILQRTSLSKTIRNVLEQTIITNIMSIQKIIGINIEVKNDEGKYEDFDVDTFEKNRNISDFSYGEEIRKKLFKIKETKKLPKDTEQYTVKDCENISNLRDIYNSLKKQDKLYGEKSANYNKEKFEIIKIYKKEFIDKLNPISGQNFKETVDIFTDDIFTTTLENLIENCSKRMKQLDPNSLLGANADFRENEREIANLENNKKIRQANIKLREKELGNFYDVGAYEGMVLEDLKKNIDKINSEIKDKTLALSATNDPKYMNELKKKLKKLQIRLEAAKIARDNKMNTNEKTKIDELKENAESLREQIPNAQQELINNAINFGNDKFKTDSAYNKIKRDAEKAASLYEDAKAKQMKSKRELERLNEDKIIFEKSDKYNLTADEQNRKRDGLKNAVARAKEEVTAAENAKAEAEAAKKEARRRWEKEELDAAAKEAMMRKRAEQGEGE